MRQILVAATAVVVAACGDESQFALDDHDMDGADVRASIAHHPQDGFADAHVAAMPVVDIPVVDTPDADIGATDIAAVELPVVEVPVDEVVIQPVADTFDAELTEEFRDDWIAPVTGRITSGFGDREGTFHDAVDIASTRGNTVVAPADLRIRTNAYHRRAGRHIIADVIGEDYRLTFAHLSRVDVYEGQRVKKGTVIGTTGISGSTTGPHLHFRVERIEDGKCVPVDPLTVIREQKITGADTL